MKESKPSPAEQVFRARSRAPWKAPQPYLTHRPGLSGRLMRLRGWVRTLAA